MSELMTAPDAHDESKRLLPPAVPGRNLVFGSAREIQRNTLQFIQTLAALGDVVRYRFVVWPTLFVNSPDNVKHVLQENNRNYDKDVPTTRLIKTVLGTGLLTADGASWLRQRRLMQPAFHRQHIAAFGSLMTAAATDMLARWDERSDDSSPLDAAAEMMGLTLRVVGLALFGADTSADAGAVGRSFTSIVDFLTRAAYQPYLMMPGVPARGKRQFQTARRELERVVYQIIARRRLQPSDSNDLLSLLLLAQDADTGATMTDRQIHDEVMTLLLAGHETTSVALSWTWYLLSMHPEVERRLQVELDTVLGGRVPQTNDLPQLAYTRMVIEEALRLYPPAWSILRRAVGEDQLGPYLVPPGTTIFISPYALHRHPAFWEHAEAFDPERFTPQRSAQRPHFAYLPFGGGPRQCIGNMFALTEAQLMLATIAQRYRLRVIPGHSVEPMPLITLRLRDGLPVHLERIA